MKLHPIKNAPGFYKDESMGIVINKNEQEYQNILEKRKHKQEITELKDELDGLKMMLKKVLENK